MERRLAAIMATDVVGYSRLIRADEEGTLGALKALRADIIDPKLAEHHGRIVKLMGDGMLAEFPSVVDAVRAAVETQRAVTEHNSGLPEDKRIRFRVGINLGDVVIDGDDIHGDGVNVAARLEGLAEAGGICISGSVHDQVRDRLDLAFEDMGEQTVKNIARPIRVWRWLEAARAGSTMARSEPLSLPDKPSIAVLPFENMSGDPEQEYFADGITEDIITELARFQNLVVIARNSTFTYKGKATRIKDVARDLGVQYVVEGSVRRAGSRVRVTVQLIESKSEKHVWAERYDRELTDIFEIQDELTKAIVGALPSRLEAADIERIKRKPPQDLAAYDYVLRSKILHHRGTKEANAEALQVLNKAIEVDPEYAQAYAWKACTLRQAILRGYAEEPDVFNAQRIQNAEKALALDENDMECLRILCEIHMEQEDLDKAEHYHNRAFALNPNDPRMLAQRGELMTWLGKPEEGVEWVQKAMQLDPLGADGFAHLLGRALRADRRYEDAIEAYKQVRVVRYQHSAELAACCAATGNDHEAAKQKAETIRLNPEFSTEKYVASLPYKNAGDREHLRDALRRAGLPE
ncbi:MAG: adenylate/guanylate cyclase domain-containing protein [Proteobacteria bacterium]|nr:adenylate/guanylate cyclase domain-containing protein [Pseudomonadota bacterium]